MSKCTLSKGGTYLTIIEGATRLRFHAIWLRDNAWDPATRSANNGQRLIALSKIPKDTLDEFSREMEQKFTKQIEATFEN